MITERHKEIAAGWQLTTNELAKNGCKFGTMLGQDAIEIPYCDMRGEPLGPSRHRLHDPSKTQDGRKYHSAKGSGVHLYVPPSYRFKRKQRILYIAEGEAKAMWAAKCGLPCIGISGAQSWQAKGVPAPEFAWFKWRGCKVYLVPDSDFRGPNPSIRIGFAKLAAFLRSHGARVRFVLLPTLEINLRGDDPLKHKTGLDDYLAARGPDAFAKLPTVARKVWEKWLPTADEAVAFDFAPRALEELIEKPPERNYVVKPWIGAGLLAYLVSTGGVGKGWFTLSLAVHVATGQKFFLGMEIKQGTVVLLCMEDPEEEVVRRLHAVAYAVADQLGLKTAKQRDLFLRQVNQHVRWQSFDGQQVHLVRERNHEIVRTDTLVRLADALRPLKPALIIPDPLSQLHGLPETNETGGAITSALGFLRRELGSAILVPAHTTKDGHDAETMEAMRGGGSFANGARSVVFMHALDDADARKTFEIAERENVDGRFLRLTHVKNNYGPKHKTVFAERTVDGVPMTSRAKFRSAFTLEDWLTAVEREEPFAKTTVTQKRLDEIFGKDACGRRASERFFDLALESGRIEEAGEAAGDKGGPKTMRYQIVRES